MNQTRIARLAAMTALAWMALGAAPGRAEERITAFVAPGGKVVFTNLAEYAWVPPAAAAFNPVATLDGMIESIAARHGIDSILVKAVIEVESAFNQRAVSPKGALGLMQLIPETGARFGVQDFFDPVQNIEGGVRYLRFLLDKFQWDLDLSLAAYNSGENRVERLGRIPAIPETQDYVRKVRSAYSRMGGFQPAQPLAMAAADAGSPDGAGAIHRSIDSRGVLRFSNIEPVR